MIVCICSNVSEKQIEDLLPASLEDVMMKTSAAMCCGQCFEYLQKITERLEEPSKLPVCDHENDTAQDSK